MSDPVANMLTSIRNANLAHHQSVVIPASNMTASIADLLKQEGFIADYEVTKKSDAQRTLTITLRSHVGRRALTDLRRISSPGLRVYVPKTKIPRVLGGLGVAIISTPRGLMTGSNAQRQGLGGEVVAYVW